MIGGIDDAWESFLTGVSGIKSLLTFGLTSIRGEPEGTTVADRLRVGSQAVLPTVVGTLDGEAFGRGVSVVAEGGARGLANVLGAVSGRAWVVIGVGGVVLAVASSPRLQARLKAVL